ESGPDSNRIGAPREGLVFEGLANLVGKVKSAKRNGPRVKKSQPSRRQEDKATRRLDPDVRRLAVFVAVAIGVFVFGWWLSGPLGDLWRLFQEIDSQSLRSAIQGMGPWAPLTSTALMLVHTFVPFPLELLAAANGVVFGTWGGIAVTWSSMVLSSWLGYGVARFAGPLVFRIAPGDRLERMEEWTRQRSDWQLVAVRFIPIISFSLLNLAMGLLGISFWRFAWTTALGIIPIVVVSVVSGHLLTIGPWGWVVVGILVLALVIWELRRRRAER
ncbi:MAG: TVP38/TMEM64 family protein, partial [Rubrobacteraceae bacterium]